MTIGIVLLRFRDAMIASVLVEVPCREANWALAEVRRIKQK
jgi:hypothetical protein